ncbi:MAG: sulfate adenylyltransferase subunit CysN [Myxococcales bacterium]|nr:sulfate adenylyltransferase subunit CysN [Myxococcales bacterium]
MREQELIDRDIVAYLARHEAKELLRFVIVGSVDDGKSTLIGRLLHDINAVYDDQLSAVKRATTMDGETVDFSLITDGLAAEREQGITIDVAYRYFATERRKFIVADTPGHVQYTRNMVTGASTADVGVILIDARLGVLEQSRRHAYIASLLGIPHLCVAVNKMDLRGYAQATFEAIRAEFRSFVDGLSFRDVTFVPVSALRGENVVAPSAQMPWYDGPTVLGYLERVPIAEDRNLADFRYPVQYVLRPNLDYRGFAAQVASGVVKKGDELLVLPSGRRTRVRAIDSADGERDAAFAPQSVTLRLEDEVDCSRGDMLVHPHNRPRVARSFEAHVVWMHERALDPQKSYWLKHTTRMVRMQVDAVRWKVDLETLAERPADTLALNDIGRVALTCHQPLYFDPYARNRATGSFVIVDSLSNNTVGAGMIIDDALAQDLAGALGELAAASDAGARTQVSPRERAEKLGQAGVTLLLHGAPEPELRVVAFALERRLFDLGRVAHVLFAGEGSSTALAWAARACTDAGLVTICVSTSDDAGGRADVRARVGEARVRDAAVGEGPIEAAVERLVALV